LFSFFQTPSSASNNIFSMSASDVRVTGTMKDSINIAFKIRPICFFNYWVFLHFPSSSILETRKHDVSET
jgi:hypothetical protein